MNKISYRDKIQFFTITQELVIEILTDKEQPFDLTDFIALHRDKDLSAEKFVQFTTTLMGLLDKGYIKSYLRTGRWYRTTNRWKWHEFHTHKAWQSWGVIIAIIAIAISLIPFICNDNETENKNNKKDTIQPKQQQTLKVVSPPKDSLVQPKTQKDTPKKTFALDTARP